MVNIPFEAPPTVMSAETLTQPLLTHPLVTHPLLTHPLVTQPHASTRQYPSVTRPGAVRVPLQQISARARARARAQSPNHAN